MKKITALFFLILLCMVYKKREVIDPVFKETEYLNTPSYCYITFRNREVNTKNMEKYFGNKTIVSIKPYIKEVYKNKMQKVENYTFTSDTYTNNIILLEKLYKENLKNNGILEEIAKIEVYGIPIKEIKLLCNKNDFSELKNLSYEIKIRNK